MTSDRILYSRKEAAAQLSISLDSLQMLIVRGEIAVRRMGSRVLVPRTELERLAKRDIPEIWPAKQNGKTTRQVA
jgi:excisionase family DNA binding protein